MAQDGDEGALVNLLDESKLDGDQKISTLEEILQNNAQLNFSEESDEFEFDDNESKNVNNNEINVDNVIFIDKNYKIKLNEDEERAFNQFLKLNNDKTEFNENYKSEKNVLKMAVDGKYNN